MLVSIQHEEQTTPIVEREMQSIPNVGDIITMTYDQTEGKKGDIFIVTDKQIFISESGQGGDGVIIWVTDYDLKGSK